MSRNNNDRGNGSGAHSSAGNRGGQSGVGNNSHNRSRTNKNFFDVRKCAQSPVFNSKIKTDAIQKPGYGTIGTPIRLIANMYPINTADITYYHYDVDIKLAQPNGASVDIEQPRVRKMRKLAQKENMSLITDLAKQWEMFNNIAYVFDGLKNLYTNKILGFDNAKQVSRNIKKRFEGNREETYEVFIQYTSEQIELSLINDFYGGKHETEPHSAIHALEVMLRYMPTQTRIPVGNKLFSRDNHKQISDIINMGFGHYQAVDLTEKGAAVVIDSEATYFYKPDNLITYVMAVMSDDIITSDKLMKIPFTKDSSLISRISRYISGLKIYTEHTGNKRFHIVDKLSFKTPIETVFDMRKEDNTKEQTNVEKYFREKYYELKFKNVPCISVKYSNDVKIPVEVCYVREHQPLPRKFITADMNANMIKESNLKPLNRFSLIQESAKMIARESVDVFNAFGVNMITSPFDLMGRVLDAPKCDGTKRVKIGKQLNDWVFINLSPEVKRKMNIEQQLDFVNHLSSTARNMGIPMKSITKDRVRNVDYVDQQTIENVYKSTKIRFPSLQMIIFCIPDKYFYNDLYRVIKYCGDIKFSVISQCIYDENILDPPKGYEYKFPYKTNGRLGGTNTALALKPKILQTSTMLIGADVSHPSETDEECFSYSIASCVGSYDNDYTKYWSANTVQVKTREEIIISFGDMVNELLIQYKRTNKSLPQKIIYYRDGVSDGQFKKVDEEYQKLMETCHKLDPKYVPKVTFIIVQKRHVKRLMPFNDNFKDKPIINIPAGTVVDRTITHPLQYEFYLNSHQGLMGTNHPIKYVVLRDDNKLTADEIQQLTYHLCYAYVKTNQSISIPTPVKYAHLAAERAKQHIMAQCVETKMPTKDETEEQRVVREKRNAALLTDNIKVSDAINASMYYC